MRALGLCLMLAGVSAAPPPSPPVDYAADLGPMPLDDETKQFIAGRGEATGHLDGRRLTVTALFRGLPSRATEAYLLLGPATGVPGMRVAPLTVSGETSGTLLGSVTLTPAQAAALRGGRLYIQINSEKAPPGYSWGPKGTVWGWLLPAHPSAAQGVPQQGSWFIPETTGPAR